MKEYRMTPDPLFPYVTTETSSELNALQLHNNKNDDVRECWDADILKCCLSHDNAIDSLTARLKYLQRKQLEKTDSSTRNNVEKQLATLQTPTNVKYLVKTNVQLKTCNSEHSSKDILPTKSDIKIEENKKPCRSNVSKSGTERHSNQGENQSLAATKTVEFKCESQDLPSDTSFSPYTANQKTVSTLPVTAVVDSLIKSNETIDDIQILGPFVEWMVPQREIIETVIKTLKRGGHAVLESPTGTGKTIALLCALLGYQLYLKQQSIETKIPVPVIYFATRTHSQIKQIIRELKKTPYRPSTVSLSGAARLCPYGKNLQEKERDNSRHHHLRCMCRNAVAATEKSRSSRFLAVSRMIKTQSLHAAYAFMKNERLKEVTVPHQSLPITECPYYATLDHLEYAEKIFKFLLPPISKEANSTISMTLNHGIWDIEDLNRVTLCNGNKNDNDFLKKRKEIAELRGCPYYTAHALVPLSDLVVLPYQLLLNPTMLARNRFFTNDSIVVFDESHNIEGVCRDEGSSVLRSDDVLFVLKILSQFIFETTQNYIRQCIATARTQLLNLHYTVPLTGTFLELLFNKLHTNFKKDGHSESLALSFASVCSIWASLQGIVQYITESVKNFSRTFPYQTGMISLFSDYIFDNDVDYPLTIHEWGPTSTQAERKNSAFFFKEMELDSRHINSLIRHMSLIYDMCMHITQSSNVGEPKENSVIVQSFHSLLGHLRNEKFFNITTYFEILKLSSHYPQCYVFYLTLFNANFDWALTLKLMVAAPIIDLLCEKKTSIILASGTLHPISSFLSEFGSEFLSKLTHVLEAPHIISSKQLLGIAVPNLLSDDSKKTYQVIPACCNASNLMKPLFLINLGSTILKFSQCIPGGILVVLPSYQSLTQVATIWKSSQKLGKTFTTKSISIWEELEILKNKVLLEPRNSTEFSTIMQLFINYVDNKGGCLLLSVYRGKFSEGFSLSDTYIRGVICVGIPYPNLKSMDIARKLKYNDTLIQKNIQLEKSNNNSFLSTELNTKSSLVSCQCENSFLKQKPVPPIKISFASGNEWYRLQAFYALNQAMGRVIRHAKDYGVLILLDSRHVSNFKKQNYQTNSETFQLSDWKSNFSKWVHPFLIQLTAEEVSKKLQFFFAAHKPSLPLSFHMPSLFNKDTFEVLSTKTVTLKSSNAIQHSCQTDQLSSHQRSNTIEETDTFSESEFKTKSNQTQPKPSNAKVLPKESILIASNHDLQNAFRIGNFKDAPPYQKSCVNEALWLQTSCGAKKNRFSNASWFTKPSLIPLTNSQSCTTKKYSSMPFAFLTQPSTQVMLERNVENSSSTNTLISSSSTTTQPHLPYKKFSSHQCVISSTNDLAKFLNASTEHTSHISRNQKRSYSSFSQPSSNILNWNLPRFSFLKKMPFSREFENDDIQNS